MNKLKKTLMKVKKGTKKQKTGMYYCSASLLKATLMATLMFRSEFRCTEIVKYY
jgi:hypothetical protein